MVKTAANPIRTPTRVPFSALAPTLTSCHTHVGDLDCVPSFGSCTALVVGMWGVNQKLRTLSVLHSQINIFFNFLKNATSKM